jgi:hypothetical protein
MTCPRACDKTTLDLKQLALSDRERLWQYSAPFSSSQAFSPQAHLISKANGAQHHVRSYAVLLPGEQADK